MERQHIDITKDLEGEPVVHAVFDLREEEIGASAHAVSAAIAERFRNEDLSADDVSSSASSPSSPTSWASSPAAPAPS